MFTCFSNKIKNIVEITGPDFSFFEIILTEIDSFSSF